MSTELTKSRISTPNLVDYLTLGRKLLQSLRCAIDGQYARQNMSVILPVALTITRLFFQFLVSANILAGMEEAQLRECLAELEAGELSDRRNWLSASKRRPPTSAIKLVRC